MARDNGCLICGGEIPSERRGRFYCSATCIFVALIKNMPHEERAFKLLTGSDEERAAWQRYQQEGEAKWKQLIASLKSNSTT